LEELNLLEGGSPMRAVPYDASRRALYTPEEGAETVLTDKRMPSEDLLCAEASRLAYKRFESDPQEQADIEKALGIAGFQDFKGFDKEGSQAFAMWNPQDGIALVAFRGTQQDLTDFASDLNFSKHGWDPGGWVHDGFLLALNRIWGDIDKWLKGREVKRRFFTGHSLGAALATLAASLQPKDTRLITIGSPRVGNADFVRTLAEVQTTRYVDCCDIVTRLPPAVFGFQHVLAERYIDQDGHIRLEIKEDEIQRDQHEAREDYFLHHSWRKGEVEVRDLADHAPINYVNVLLNV
jgi:hypothetical protein